jgi:hypothetical protein
MQNSTSTKTMSYKDRECIKNFCYTLYAFGLGDKDWYIEVLQYLNNPYN